MKAGLLSAEWHADAPAEADVQALIASKIEKILEDSGFTEDPGDHDP